VVALASRSRRHGSRAPARSAAILALVFPCILPAAASGATCAIEHARYALRQTPGYTADFASRTPTPDWPADVLFVIHSAHTGKTYVFLPYSGNGAGVTTHLASVTDPAHPPGPDGPPSARPLGDMDYVAADEAYVFDQRFWAHAGAAAPAHLLIQDLQAALWYRTDPRETVPVAFFDLVGCTP